MLFVALDLIFFVSNANSKKINPDQKYLAVNKIKSKSISMYPIYFSKTSISL
jgi:hypothetical protein